MITYVKYMNFFAILAIALGWFLVAPPLSFNLSAANHLKATKMEEKILTKRCTICNEVKPLSDFYKRPDRKSGYYSECKKCGSIKVRNYYHTKNGFITQLYSDQRKSSKIRGYKLPTYSKQQLYNWLFSQPKFHKLFEIWKNLGYDKMLTPSVDRIDDYKPYTMDNIQLMTWGENKKKGWDDRKNGINNKASKAVLQFDKQGNFIKEYYSIKQAERETGIHNANISKTCSNKIKTAGGYKWEYKTKYNETENS